MGEHSFTRVLVPPKKIVVISSPSGAGKSSIVKKLLGHFHEMAFSVSCTTREKREGEKDGDHYHFLSVDEFKKRMANGDFAEYEEVYPGKFYGTLKSEIEKIWNERKVAIFDIDVKGAMSLKKQFGDDCLTIYIAPPSKESLVNRLKNRGTETPKSLKERVARFEEELSYQNKFDKVVVNKDFDTAYMRAKNCITAFLQPQTTHIY